MTRERGDGGEHLGGVGDVEVDDDVDAVLAEVLGHPGRELLRPEVEERGVAMVSSCSGHSLTAHSIASVRKAGRRRA